MSDPTRIATVIAERYMSEQHPVNGEEGVHYFFVGMMVDADHQPIENISMIIDDRGHGQHWYYCRDDKTVFPINGSCPACGRSVRAERHDPTPPLQASVRPTNSVS